MTRTELIRLLDELGLHPSRKLGQNFLIDANLLDWTIRTAAPQPGEPILEIGPGTGVLTGRLIESGARVTAVELDHRLAEWIRKSYGGTPDFRLVQGDACDVDYAALMGPEADFRCIANLPYAVSSVIIARFLELPKPPRELYVLLQIEMADRLRAAVGTKDYNALTVQVQAEYEVQVLRRIAPAVFFPPPEVDSAYVRFRRRENAPDAARRAALREIVRLAFSQRRKQMRKLLRSRFPEEKLDAACAALNIPADARAETVTVPQFLRLAEMLGG